MVVEIRPLGVACNLACTYCYQEPQRVANNRRPKYNIEKMIEEIEKTGQNFHLFGGEALLVPKKDLERFWAYGYEKFKSNGIQTNGTLIDKDHIELFKKYNVHVGVSIDGPNELNNLRKVRGKESDDDKTLDATKTIMDNIQQMVKEGVSVSVIITLYKLNATKEKLPRLLNFIRWLGDIGVKNGNIHKLEVDETMPDQEIHVLSQEENLEAFITIAKWLEEEANKDLKWNPFEDYEEALVKDKFDHLTCYLNRCDAMNTQAVYGIEGDGGLSNCGRTNKEGIDWYKAEDTSYERYISLYQTPDEHGGCQGCRFFMVCSGGCPGEAIDGDFRNKTIHCQTYKGLFSFYEDKAEEQGLVPWTKRKDRFSVEESFFQAMFTGVHTNVEIAKEKSRSSFVVEVRGEKDE